MRRIIWLVLVLALSWGSLAYGSTNDFLPKLGLDLKGGISAILTAPEGTDPELLEQTVDVMLRRIEGIGGVQEPEISTQGDRNVLVQLPGVTDQEEALRVLGATGQLSFRTVLGTALPSQVDLTLEDDPTPRFLDPVGGRSIAIRSRQDWTIGCEVFKQFSGNEIFVWTCIQPEDVRSRESADAFVVGNIAFELNPFLPSLRDHRRSFQLGLPDKACFNPGSDGRRSGFKEVQRVQDQFW